MSERAGKGADWVALLGTKGGPAIRPGSTMPTSSLLSLGGARIGRASCRERVYVLV